MSESIVSDHFYLPLKRVQNLLTILVPYYCDVAKGKVRKAWAIIDESPYKETERLQATSGELPSDLAATLGSPRVFNRTGPLCRKV